MNDISIGISLITFLFACRFPIKSTVHHWRLLGAAADKLGKDIINGVVHAIISLMLEVKMEKDQI